MVDHAEYLRAVDGAFASPDYRMLAGIFGATAAQCAKPIYDHLAVHYDSNYEITGINIQAFDPLWAMTVKQSVEYQGKYLRFAYDCNSSRLLFSLTDPTDTTIYSDIRDEGIDGLEKTDLVVQSIVDGVRKI